MFVQINVVNIHLKWQKGKLLLQGHAFHAKVHRSHILANDEQGLWKIDRSEFGSIRWWSDSQKQHPRTTHNEFDQNLCLVAKE